MFSLIWTLITIFVFIALVVQNMEQNKRLKNNGLSPVPFYYTVKLMLGRIRKFFD